jgi:hypothetical protein
MSGPPSGWTKLVIERSEESQPVMPQPDSLEAPISSSDNNLLAEIRAVEMFGGLSLRSDQFTQFGKLRTQGVGFQESAAQVLLRTLSRNDQERLSRIFQGLEVKGRTQGIIPSSVVARPTPISQEDILTERQERGVAVPERIERGGRNVLSLLGIDTQVGQFSRDVGEGFSAGVLDAALAALNLDARTEIAEGAPAGESIGELLASIATLGTSDPEFRYAIEHSGDPRVAALALAPATMQFLSPLVRGAATLGRKSLVVSPTSRVVLTRPAIRARDILIRRLDDAAKAGQRIIVPRSIELGRRSKSADEILMANTGERAFALARSKFGGALPTETLVNIRQTMDPNDINEMVETIRTSNRLSVLEKIRSQEALANVLAGKLPEPKELERLGEIFGSELVTAITRPSYLKQAKDVVESIVNVPRTMITMLDSSGVLRQGGVLSVAEPRIAVRAFNAMLRTAIPGSGETFARNVDEAIKRSPFAQIADDAGLYIAQRAATSKGVVTSTLEEAYMGSLVHKIPFIGGVARISERMYTTYLNKLRFDTFAKYAGDKVKDTETLLTFAGEPVPSAARITRRIPRAKRTIDELLEAGGYDEGSASFISSEKKARLVKPRLIRDVAEDIDVLNRENRRLRNLEGKVTHKVEDEFGVKAWDDLTDSQEGFIEGVLDLDPGYTFADVREALAPVIRSNETRIKRLQAVMAEKINLDLAAQADAIERGLAAIGSQSDDVTKVIATHGIGSQQAKVAIKQATERELKDLARVINWTTGRGPLGPLSNAGGLLNAIFFSPRFVTSRIATPLLPFISSGVARKVAARSLVSWVAVNTGMLAAISRVPGVDVEIDPRSSDFGRIKIGNTRIDFWAGFQPLARYTAQIWTSTSKQAGTGNIREIRSMRETFERLLRSKLSPQVGAAVDIISGRTFIGEELTFDRETVESQAYQKLVPLFIQDVIEVVSEEGALGAFAAGPSFFGAGVMAYKATGDQLEDVSRRLFADQPSLDNRFDTILEQAEQSGDSVYNILDTMQRRLVNNSPEIQATRAVHQAFDGLEDSVVASVSLDNYRIRKTELETELRAALEQNPNRDFRRKLIKDFKSNRFQAAESNLNRVVDQYFAGDRELPLADVYAVAWLNVPLEIDPVTGDADFFSRDRERESLLRQAEKVGVTREFITGTDQFSFRGQRFEDDAVRQAVEEYEQDQEDMAIYLGASELVLGHDPNLLGMFQDWQRATGRLKQDFKRRGGSRLRQAILKVEKYKQKFRKRGIYLPETERLLFKWGYIDVYKHPANRHLNR